MNNSTLHFKRKENQLTAKTKSFWDPKINNNLLECKVSQQQIWDKLSGWWNKFRQRPVPEVEKFLKNKKGKVLDLGCGSGRNMILNKNAEYYGVDFSEEMLKHAEKNAKNKNIKAIFLKADIGNEKLPFENDFFDAGVFISTLHSIDKSKKRLKALKELHRVMKENSETIISVWDKNGDEKLREIKGKEAYLNWKADGKNYKRYYYFYDKEELLRELKKAGFKVMKKEAKIKSKHGDKNFIFYVRK